MSLPPERVLLVRKKRKVEDTVDVLYIQNSKRRNIEEFHYRRLRRDETVEDAGRLQTSKSPERAPTAPGTAPVGRASLSSNADVDKPASRLSKHGGKASGDIQEDCSVALIKRNDHKQSHSKSRAARSEPRRFYLSKSQMNLRSSIDHDTQRNKRPSRKDLAVFREERRSSKLKSRSSVNLRGQGSQDTAPAMPTTEPRRPLKRPNVTQTELRWRAKNWGKPFNNEKDTAGANEDDLVLATALRAFALEQDPPSRPPPTASPQAVTPHPKPALKFQPKSPTRRQPSPTGAAAADSSHERTPNAETPEPDLVMHDQDSAAAWSSSEEDEEDSDLVTDTYIRVPHPHPDPVACGASYGGIDGSVDPELITPGSRVGVLVIRDEDEEAWDAFAEDAPDSDADADSEDEDENAEDYYGNDYPEDEVDEDDEFGRGAYGFRQGASSDEEFGADQERMWSDDEDGNDKGRAQVWTGAGRRWGAAANAEGGGPGNEFASPVSFGTVGMY